mgnify:CR=1 FL=1
MFDLSAYGQWLPNTPPKPLGTPKKQTGTRGTPQNKAVPYKSRTVASVGILCALGFSFVIQLSLAPEL